MKKPIYKRWWFIVICVIVIVGIIGSIGDNEEAPIANSGDKVQSEEPQVNEPEQPDFIKSGMYKVGTDLEAGEYMVLGDGYGQVSSDSTGSFDSIITNDNYENSWYITVNDGEYLEFSGKAYPIATAPIIDSSGASLPSGMYKVGKDIAAGEYKVTATDSGYVEVSKGARGSINDIISNDNFSGDKYITVSEGQYLTLSRAELLLQ